MVSMLAKNKEFVSTHSRLKAAGGAGKRVPDIQDVSTHSRLKAAGYGLGGTDPETIVSTHSRLKAAGKFASEFGMAKLFQHTAA